VTTPTPSDTPLMRERRALPPAAAWWLAALAVLPFAAVYVGHYAGNPDATGFIQVDMPYYAANGREIFERGNGFAHPNAYEPGPHPPVIYFHWFTWLLGFGIARVGIDPGLALVALGAVGALLFARVTLRLVAAVLVDARCLVPLYLGVMWGGGVLCLGRVFENVLAGRSATHVLLLHDPHLGQWFLSWGRNAVYPTEAAYHALAALVFLLLLRARWKGALLATAALAATHPWSGTQALAIVGAWSTVELVRQRGRAALMRWLGVLALAAAFFAYYFVYLPSFAEHRVLNDRWRVGWTLPTVSALLGYGPVALLAACRLWVDRRRLDARVGFLLVAFGVSGVLAKHELLVDPVQPLHFTRGYVWLPLCLIALPLMQRALVAARARWRPLPYAAACGALLLVASADNLGAIGTALSLHPHLGLQLSPDERAAFRWMDAERLDGVLLCDDTRLGYLSATYTRLRPYLGHPNNTPGAPRRVRQILQWVDGSDPGDWDPPPDYVLVTRASGLAPPAGGAWTLLHENESCVLYGRAL
jgi:hypothetical protein